MNPLRKVLLGSALAGATLVGGAVGAGLVGTAGAESNSTPATAPASTAPSTASGQAPTGASTGAPTGAPNGPQGQAPGPHQANGKTEALLTGDQKTKAEAAAKAAVDGGTVERSETDAEGAAFEVHMTKGDGSQVTVKLDASYKVTSIEDGHA